MFAGLAENVANQSSDIYSNKTRRVIDGTSFADTTNDVDSRRPKIRACVSVDYIIAPRVIAARYSPPSHSCGDEINRQQAMVSSHIPIVLTIPPAASLNL